MCLIRFRSKLEESWSHRPDLRIPALNPALPYSPNVLPLKLHHEITLYPTVHSFFIIQLTIIQLIIIRTNDLSQTQNWHLSNCLPSLSPHIHECVSTRQHLCVCKHMGCLIHCIMQWDSSENTMAIGLGLSTRTTQLSSPSSWTCYGTQQPSSLPQGSTDGKTNLSLQTEPGHVGWWKHKANTRHPRSYLDRPLRQTGGSKLCEPWSNSPIWKVTSNCSFDMKSSWLLHATGMP